MSFLLSMVTMVTFLSTEIRWKQDVLHVPLHENIDNYRFLPEASLWIHGIRVHDALMYYERNGVEWTFISTVNTAVVRSYMIKYKVHFPTYNISQIKTIIFHVEDRIPPVIVKVPHFRLPLGSKMPDLIDGLVFIDNYDPIDKLSISIQSSEVILSRIGIYPIRYQITDVSKNMTEAYGSFEVYDHLPPEITLKKPIIISFGERVNYADYFLIKDNYDAVLKIHFDDSQVNYKKLGSYPVSISATDQSGLSMVVFEELTIIDTKSPAIILKSIPKIIPVHHVFDREALLGFVLSVNDDVDTLGIDDIEVIHDIEFDTLGTYAVYYTVSDRSLNRTSLKLTISVKDISPPEIWFKEPFVFDVFQIEPHLLSLIDVKDNHADVSHITVKVSGSFKMHIVGVYPITITATDPSGNTNTIRTHVEIKDRVPPVIIQNHDIIITDFKPKSLVHYFTFSDQYTPSSELSIWIEDDQVDYQTKGEYALRACAKDSSHNIFCLDSHLMVVDIEEPTITLKTSIVYLHINQEPVDLISLIEAISDNHDILDFELVKIESSIDYQKPGRYTVTYTIQDGSFNHQSAVLIVIVDDYTPPFVSLLPIEMSQYQHFDPFEDIDAYDHEGPVTIYVSPANIDTSIAGTYILVYTIQDDRGNFTTAERLITIKPQKQTFTLDSFTPLIIFSVLGFMSLYYIYRKMS